MKTICTIAISLLMMISPTNPPDLNSLRQGGHILYVRHAEATVGSDQEEINWDDCSTQRNLSEAGRRQALAYGEALRRAGIPVQFPVTVSPFCRTRQTAELAFGVGNVQREPFWVTIYNLNNEATSPSYQESVLTAVTSVLEVIPPMGKNKVIVAHSFPQGVALGEIPDMGTVIIKPLGQGKGYEVVDTLSYADFIEISAYTH